MASIIDSDDVVVPTPEALSAWVLHFSFLVGHKRTELDPTHTRSSHGLDDYTLPRFGRTPRRKYMNL